MSGDTLAGIRHMAIGLHGRCLAPDSTATGISSQIRPRISGTQGHISGDTILIRPHATSQNTSPLFLPSSKQPNP